MLLPSIAPGGAKRVVLAVAVGRHSNLLANPRNPISDAASVGDCESARSFERGRWGWRDTGGVVFCPGT